MKRATLVNENMASDSLSFTGETASGTKYIFVDGGQYDTIRAQLEVTAASGTSPTLDVKIQDSLDGTNWNDLITFTQATAATREVQNYTSPFARRLRVEYTIGGTTPSFDFNLKILLKG